MRNFLVRTLIAAVAAVAIQALAAPAHAVPLPKPRPNIVVADSPRLCLARAIYVEARNQPLLGKLLVGYTLKRRAEIGRADFGGGSYCGVAYAKTRLGRMQYSGMTADRAFVADDARGWSASLEAADRVLKGYRPLYEWSEATYYLNRADAERHNRCWFERNLVELGWSNDHLFYREPRDAMEALIIRTGERSPSCARAKHFPYKKPASALRTAHR